MGKALSEILDSAFGLHALVNLCQLDCVQQGTTGRSRKYDLQRRLKQTGIGWPEDYMEAYILNGTRERE